MPYIARILINYLEHIVGISEPVQCSWEIASPLRNCHQTKYQIQISTDAAFSTKLLDTLWVESDQSSHIYLKEFKPQQGVLYYIRVRCELECEQKRHVTPFSDSATVLGPLSNPNQLKDYFISAEQECDIPLSKGTYLRKAFTLQKRVSTAVVYSTAQGMYQLHLNGHRVSLDQLAPGWSSYERRLLYQSYVVTDLLTEGKNALAAHLGAGWYKGDLSFLHIHNFYGPYTALSLLLEVTYEDGSKELIYTDESWKGDYSPIVESELYDGEIYDANLEQEFFDTPLFDDSSWRFARKVPCTSHRIEAQTGSTVMLKERVSPKLAFFTPKGERVIDFGQNMSAHVEIRGQGKAGDKVVLTCFEVLDKDGNVYTENLRKAKQKITYILKDDKNFVYRPHFTFFGYRFIHVESFCSRSDVDNLCSFAIHSTMEQRGTFSCSNDAVNQLQHNILWGLKSNFVDIPTDCPQRDERLGWTGDAQIFCRTATFNVDTYTFFSKWLRDLALDQTQEGGVPHVVPDVLYKYPFDNWLLNAGTHSAAAWADAAIIVPWVLYLSYGDTTILQNQYESMKKWIDFMKKHANGNIWNYKRQFGDWVALDAEEGSYFGATPNDLTCTAYYAYSTLLFSKTASILGNRNDESYYFSLYQDIVSTFQKTFFDEEGRMTVQTQTAHILALHFNLTPEKYLKKTIKGLQDLLAKHDGHLVTGFVGTPYFCHALSSHDCVGEAYDLLLKDDFPSWLYQVKKGATTIWEHWDGIKPDGSMWSANMNSFNHYAYGAIGEWLYRVVAGLEIDEKSPGYKHSIIAPRIGGNLTFAQAKYRSIYGEISVKWDVEKHNTILLTACIPPNTSATIRLHEAEQVLFSDSLHFSRKDVALEAEAGSGTYKIRYRLR